MMFTKDEIVDIAKQAGYQHPDAIGICEDFAYFDLETFAKLVAAQATAKEREACAKMCEKDDSMRWSGAADAIRARGKAQ